MQKALSLLGIGVFTTTLMACGAEKVDKGSSAVKPAVGPVTGAIWTTVEDGSIVNENHYADCRMVYLNGGPKKEKGEGKGLPAGDYYFMVTDPSGKELLSSDSIAERKVRVGSTGEFESYLGNTHDTGMDVDDGSLTVQLWPFIKTPNPGGVYKVWLTPVAAYDPSGTSEKQYVHGFPHSRTKTDNFKCDMAMPPGEDAGPPPTDAGPPGEDAGPPPTDAGPPPPCEGEECVEEL